MTEEKTHWKNMHNYDYLGSYSLLPGQELILTIRDMKHEKVKDPNGKESTCFVAHFVEPQKPMVLNKTNCKIIAKIYQTDFIEDWKGKKIQVYSSKVKAFGEEVDALRVRNSAPIDTTALIAKIKACKSEAEIMKLWEANKPVWHGEVKRVAQEVNKSLKGGQQ